MHLPFKMCISQYTGLHAAAIADVALIAAVAALAVAKEPTGD